MTPSSSSVVSLLVVVLPFFCDDCVFDIFFFGMFDYSVVVVRYL